MGWIGPTKQLLFYLSTAGADQDADGAYLITGAPVTLGLGGDEAVVSDATCYLVNGQRKALAAELCTTSYGTKVMVLG